MKIAGSDPRAKLEAMALAERVAAVAVDVDSKRDEYRSIDAHDLALLLDISDVYQPGYDWTRIHFVPREPIESILETWGVEYPLELLERHVAAERYEELNSQMRSVVGTESATGLINFLTDVEKHIIERTAH